MAEERHPLEKRIAIWTYRGIDFEVVERPDVFWVGCLGYAHNLTDEPDIGATLRRFQALVSSVPIREKVNPDWSAALSIHYGCGDQPRGMMFGNESFTADQDERYDVLVQPGGLWLRVRNDAGAAQALLGREQAEPSAYFALEMTKEQRNTKQEPGNGGSCEGDAHIAESVLQKVAGEHGYMPHPDVPIQIEYHCHAEYGLPEHTNFAYIPICKNQSL